MSTAPEFVEGTGFGGFGLGGEAGEQAIATTAGCLEVAGFQRKAEAIGEGAAVNGDLTPPGSVVVKQVVVRIGISGFACEVDGWLFG